MEKDKDVITVVADSSRPYRILSSVLAVILAATAFFAGLALPKPSSAVSRRLTAYEKKDREYLEAFGAFTASENELKNLNTKADEMRDELQKFNKSQNGIDIITTKNDELSSKAEQLRNELNSKRALLEMLNGDTEKHTNTTLTLSSGRYTVGENLVAGTYTITGTGSIVISNSGKAHVNKSLKSDGETFTLAEGDILKIDGNAKLTQE